RPPAFTLFPYTTLFRSCGPMHYVGVAGGPTLLNIRFGPGAPALEPASAPAVTERLARLRADRGAGRTEDDYVLGRGDLLSIRALDRKSTRLNSSHQIIS